MSRNPRGEVRSLGALSSDFAFEEGDKLKPPQDRVAGPVSAFQV